MKKLRKVQSKVIATAFIALIGGLTIWSCSQDELDDFGQPIYRYTAEEIATLKTLAEDYEYPTKNLVFESNTPLPSIEEWEEQFQVAYGIKRDLSSPLDTIAISNDTIHLRSTIIQKPFKRIHSGAMEYSGSTQQTFRKDPAIDGEYINGNFAYIDVKVTLTNASPTDPRDPAGSTSKTVSVSASMSLSTQLRTKGYKVDKFDYSWVWRGSSTIEVPYSYKITNPSKPSPKPIEDEYFCLVNVASILH